MRTPLINNNRSSRMFGLDLVRFLAANSILLWHYQHFYYEEPGRFLADYSNLKLPLYSWLSIFYRHGFLAVQVFWMISGIVFSVTYLGRASKVSGFLIHRIARLIPLYYLLLSLTLIIQIAEVLGKKNSLIYNHGSVSEILLSLFMINNSRSLLAPTWSLTLEIFCFPLFILLMRARKMLKIHMNLGFICLFLILNTRLTLADTFANLSILFTCGIYFFTGTLIGQVLNLRYFREASLIFIILGISLQNFYLCLSGVLTIIARMSMPQGSKSIKLIDKLGNVSYAVFLIHIPSQIIVIRISDLFSIPRLQMFNNPLTLLVYLSMVNLGGFVLWKFYEAPIRRKLLKKYSK